MKELVDGFRAFIFRGNVLDLAVAVVIGAAFNQIVNSLVANIITPLVGAIGGVPDFSNLTVTINNSVIHYGAFLNALISFLITASVIYFLIVKPINTLMERVSPTPPQPDATVCPHCLREVAPQATRCPSCTSWLHGTDAALS
jgi:large conductance mechanosensitive channel